MAIALYLPPPAVQPSYRAIMNELQWYGGSVLVDSTERSAYYVRDRRWVGFDIEESMWSKIQVGTSVFGLPVLRMLRLDDIQQTDCCKPGTVVHYVTLCHLRHGARAGRTAIRRRRCHDLGRLPGRARGHAAAGGGFSHPAARAALRRWLHRQRAVRQRQRVLLRGGLPVQGACGLCCSAVECCNTRYLLVGGLASVASALPLVVHSRPCHLPQLQKGYCGTTEAFCGPRCRYVVVDRGKGRW